MHVAHLGLHGHRDKQEREQRPGGHEDALGVRELLPIEYGEQRQHLRLCQRHGWKDAQMLLSFRLCVGLLVNHVHS